MGMKIHLDSLKVLVFDCQASHPNPQQGHLLETAWGVLDEVQEKRPFFSQSMATLIKPNPDFELPRQVSRVTGISIEALRSGQPAADVWQQLLAAAHQLSKIQSLDSCPTVIHYSRYEESFLKHLHELFSPELTYPFDIICTHKISQRLWPELPRRGLRALAGFLGYSVEEFRRSTHHIEATAWIWRKVVTLLVNEHGITTIDDLKRWLERKSSKKSGQRIYPMPKEKRGNLPQQPGVYHMYRSNGDILYVGKATSLRQRVNSYFQKRSAHAEHKLEMLSQAVDLSFTETTTALEAALLETDEIKKYSPPYNIALKSGSRKMVYATAGLNAFSSESSDEHFMGPYPSSKPLLPYPTLSGLLSGFSLIDIDETTIESLLNVPADFLPELGCVLQGIEHFRDKYRGVLKNPVGVENLLTLANYLHQEKLDLAIEEDEDLDDIEDDDPEEFEETEFEWTPETVCRHLEGVLRFGAHLIRRTRWFCDLSESVLAWREKGETSAICHLLILAGGTIQTRAETLDFRSIPIPPGVDVPLNMRKNNLDLATYDRLRVLTTEIRRLVNENRVVFLRLREKQVLDGEKLKKRLLWH